MTPILALDLGTTTGWAYRNPDGVISTGTAKFANGRYHGGGYRFVAFRAWLIYMLQAPDVRVYFEEVRRHLGVDAAHIYGGFLAHLTGYCEQHEIPYCGVPVQTIKKHATGKGNAKKDAMVEAANAAGCITTDDNEADAFHILAWAIKEVGNE